MSRGGHQVLVVVYGTISGMTKITKTYSYCRLYDTTHISLATVNYPKKLLFNLVELLFSFYNFLGM